MVASTGENLRSYLLSSPDIASHVSGRAYHNVVPSRWALPFIWFARYATDDAEFPQEGYALPYRERWNLEVVDDSVDEADELAELVRIWLHEHTGTMGLDVYSLVLVRTVADDYTPRNQAADEHLTVMSFDLEIINP